jgi:sugar phosphate isomerase/epimerase
MKQILSTQIFLRQRLSASALSVAVAAGMDGIEVVAARHHFDYTSQEHIRELGAWFAANKCAPWGLHAPYSIDQSSEFSGGIQVSLLNPDKSRRIDSMDEVKRALDAADFIPFKYLILQLGNRDDYWSARTLEHAISALEHLGAFAAPLGIKLLVKNGANEATEPEHLIEILTAGHFRNIGLALDTGEANASVGLQQSFDILGARTAAVYLRDNKGHREEQLWPGEGAIDWVQARKAIQALPQETALVLSVAQQDEIADEDLIVKIKAGFASIT